MRMIEVTVKLCSHQKLILFVCWCKYVESECCSVESMWPDGCNSTCTEHDLFVYNVWNLKYLTAVRNLLCGRLKEAQINRCGQPEIQLQKNDQEGLRRGKIAPVLNLDTLQNEKMGTYVGI